MAVSRTVVIAGAGIGGLTAALALAQQGFRASVLEAAERLDEIGAGIQLSPNASRILLSLGLGDALKPQVVAPTELNVMNARSGRTLARAPLGTAAEQTFGAPFWVIHRGDLQAALLAAVRGHPDIALQLGTTVDDFAVHADGITIVAHHSGHAIEEHGTALIGADGLWSGLRRRLGHRTPPRFAHHAAWRALIPAEKLPAELSAPSVNLWLGSDAHLVHYPVKGGALINVVAILKDEWHQADWSAYGDPTELRERFDAGHWHERPRALIAAALRWHKWALHDIAPLGAWGTGPVTLLGDAAHAMLPYLAQGAAMAIEDSAVLALCLAGGPDDPAAAMRAYEKKRRARTARTQQAARRNGHIYHMGAAGAALRTLALKAMGGSGLIRSYDWLYRWTPE